MTPTTPTSGAADLASRLRNACTSVRSKSYPLADLIPLMQQAADALASAPAQPVAEPSYEHQRAIMEGERNASLDAYSRVIYLTGAESQLYEAGFTNGWQRASRGQAPAGTTEPTEQQILEAAEKAGLWPNTVHSWIPAFHRYHKELAKAQPAPAQADSVQEDAADPLQGAANWLAEAHGQFSPVILSGCLMIGYNRANRLHDAALAARKHRALHPPLSPRGNGRVDAN